MSLQSFRDWLISDDVMWANALLSTLFFIFSGMWTLGAPDAILPRICLALPIFSVGIPLTLSFIFAWNNPQEADY